MANTGYGACEAVMPAAANAVAKRATLTSGATTWHAKRKPWCKAYTCSSKPAVLGDSGTNITSLYHTDSGKNFSRPKPGITSFECSQEGTHGGFQTAKLNFTCWTRDDFNEMSQAFLWYGVTVMVEWGWSVNQDGGAVTEIGSYPNCATSDFDMQKAINGHIDVSKGCYDSLRGTVVDFSWSLGENGSFECVCEINSMAQCPAKMPIRVTTKNCKCATDKEEHKNPTFNSLSVIDGAIKDCSADPHSKKYGGVLGAVGLTAATSDAESTGMFASVIKAVVAFFGGGTEDFCFVTFEVFEEWMVNESSLPLSKGKNPGITRDQAWGYVGAPKKKRSCFSSSKHAYSSLFMSHHSRLRGSNSSSGRSRLSGDPTVCLLPGSKEQKIMTDEFAEHAAYDSAADCFDGDSIALPNILLNVNMIQEEFDKCTKETGAGEFMQAVLSRVNEACGGVWNMKMVPMAECEAVIQWLDIDQQPGSAPTSITIPSYGKDSVCRSVSSNTEVDPDLKAHIMLSSNTKATKGNSDVGGGIRLWAADVTDTFHDGLELVKKCNDETKPKDCDTNPSEDEDEPSINDTIASIGKEINPERVAAGKAIARKIALNEDTSATGKEPIFIQPVPIGITVEMDGIGGFKFGNLIRTTHLPTGYDGWKFQVTAVTQKVTNADWTTSLEAPFMRKL